MLQEQTYKLIYWGWVLPIICRHAYSIKPIN